MEATSDARKKVWNEWKAYCHTFGVDPYLDGETFTTIIRLSTGFGGNLRKGRRGRPIGTGSVCTGIGSINTQIALDTGDQTLHQRGGEHFLKPLQHMLSGFTNFDPAVEKKLAVGPDVPKFAVEWAHRRQTSPQQQAVGDLIIVAFYYLLRIGEYTTKGKRTKQTHTRQF